jgi:sulfoacetaldehyde acetyltransferase
MMIAQNGPGITNFVTPVKTAYWNHTPLLLVTPQAANKTIGQGGFQEIEQMKLFEDMVAYQEEVRDPSRIAEVLNRVIMKAKRGSAPAQINMPRDFWTQVIDIELPQIVELRAPGRRRTGIAKAAELLSESQVPGHPERRRRGARRAIKAIRQAGRAARCAGLLGLPAQ